MKKLTEKELKKVEGGFDPFQIYEEAKDFVNNKAGDLIRGFKDGWKNN